MGNDVHKFKPTASEELESDSSVLPDPPRGQHAHTARLEHVREQDGGRHIGVNVTRKLLKAFATIFFKRS